MSNAVQHNIQYSIGVTELPSGPRLQRSRQDIRANDIIAFRNHLDCPGGCQYPAANNRACTGPSVDCLWYHFLCLDLLRLALFSDNVHPAGSRIRLFLLLKAGEFSGHVASRLLARLISGHSYRCQVPLIFQSTCLHSPYGSSAKKIS